jgi:hypothetical protein
MRTMRMMTTRRGPRGLYTPPTHNERTPKHQKKIGHERIVDPNLPLAPIASSNLATSTKPPQSLPATLDLSHLITPPMLVMRVNKNLLFPIKTVCQTHPRTSQRFPRHNTAKNTMHNAFQKTNKESLSVLATSIPRIGGGSSGRKKRNMPLSPQLHRPEEITIPILTQLLDAYKNEQFTKIIQQLPEEWQEINEKVT